MQNLFSKIGCFVIGGTIGALATYKILSDKYEKLIQEEIDSVKESFSKPLNNDVESEFDNKNADDVDAVDKIINQNGYLTESENKEESGDMKDKNISIISPEEFEESDYTVVSLYYYEDGIVANDRHKMIGNAEELIGNDFASHFGDYKEDPDTVYVKNNEQHIVYEVMREYEEFLES
jgi:hypothetical protein